MNRKLKVFLIAFGVTLPSSILAAELYLTYKVLLETMKEYKDLLEFAELMLKKSEEYCPEMFNDPEFINFDMNQRFNSIAENFTVTKEG